MLTSRLMIVLLVALNALAFAAIKGWLGNAPPRGEAERISNQLHPEQIRLATADETAAPPPTDTPDAPDAPDADTAAPAPAAAVEPTAEPVTPAVEPAAPPPANCTAWTELATEDADRLAARLNAAGIKFQRSRKDMPTSWWVRTPPRGSRALAEKRVQELRELGITDTFIVQDGGPSQHAVSLGLFRTENSAQQLLAQLRAKGARDALTETRMTTSFRIQANVAPERLRSVEGRRSTLSQRRAACKP